MVYYMTHLSYNVLKRFDYDRKDKAKVGFRHMDPLLQMKLMEMDHAKTWV